MAKRKHSTALFEVITTSRRYTKPQPAVVGAARGSWWFNRWARTGGIEAAGIKQGGSGHASPGAVANFRTSAESPPPMETPIEEQAACEHDDQSGHHEDQRHDEHEEYGESAVAMAAEQDDILGMPRAQSVAVSVDADRRQIALRMSYTAAIIGGFSVLVLVGLSIIVGQHMSRNGAPLLAQTTSRALQESPAHREIMDVPRQTFANPNAVRPEPRPAGQMASPSGNPQTGPSTAVESRRMIGLNYVIVQGYAAKEEDMANKAAAFLNKHGIACTVEKDVKGYSPVTVVGLRGFDRQTSPDIKAYVQKIEELSGEYTTNIRGYKAFTPLIKKWDKTN